MIASKSQLQIATQNKFYVKNYHSIKQQNAVCQNTHVGNNFQEKFLKNGHYDSFGVGLTWKN